MAKKIKTPNQRDVIGVALQDALNKSFEFGMAHQRVLDAQADASGLYHEAMELNQALADLVIPRDKSKLN